MSVARTVATSRAAGLPFDAFKISEIHASFSSSANIVSRLNNCTLATALLLRHLGA